MKRVLETYRIVLKGRIFVQMESEKERNAAQNIYLANNNNNNDNNNNSNPPTDS